MNIIKNLKNTCNIMGIYHGLRFLINGKLVKWSNYSFTDGYFHWRSSKYISRSINKSKQNIELIKKRDDIPENNCWIFWWQGIENAPSIVKACYKSVEESL